MSGDPWHRRGFAEWLRSLNYATPTCKNYLSSVEQFVVWCEERSLDEPALVQRHHVQRYQRYLYHYRIRIRDSDEEKPLTTKTQLTKLIAIRTYFRCLVKRKWLVLSPATDLDLPKQGRRLPKYILSVEEVQQLFALADVNRPGGLRDRAMFELLYSSGIRRTELCNLRICDLDLQQGTAMVREGKGGHDRMVPVGTAATHWLTRYLEAGRPDLVGYKDPGVLFLTPGGRGLRPDSLTALVKRYLKRSDFPNMEGGGPHLLRHACATHMLEGGADIRYVQELLGHASLTTTQIYTRVSIRKLKEVHARTHPSSQLQPDAGELT